MVSRVHTYIQSLMYSNVTHITGGSVDLSAIIYVHIQKELEKRGADLPTTVAMSGNLMLNP